MTERMVYGSSVWGVSNANGYNCGVEKSQLDLFKHRHDLECIRAWYWLRDIQSAVTFAGVGNSGAADRHGASDSRGVRPACVLG